jgi:lipid A 3-O-deacylase
LQKPKAIKKSVERVRRVTYIPAMTIKCARSSIPAVLALLGLAAPALAQGLVHELKFGILDHDTTAMWSNFRAEPDSADINIEAILSPSMIFMGGTIRPAVGASINTQGATSSAYVDARWQYEFRGGMFFGLGLGAVVHNGHIDDNVWDRKQLGSRVLFHIPIEVGYRLDGHNSLSLYFEHMSNAYTVTPNEGLDRIGIRYGYTF